MKHSRLLAILAAFVLALASCGPDEPEKVTVSVSPTSLSFDSDGGSQSLNVQSNGSWTVRVDGGWITASTFSGSGNGSVEVTAAANDGDVREGSLTIASADQSVVVAVSQKTTPITEISKVRALYKDADVKITDKTLVKGTVVSNFRSASNGGVNNYTSQKTIVIQDATGGLQLFCGQENTNFGFGDIVQVDLTGQTLSVYQNGPIQVNGLPIDRITKLGSETPSAKQVTIEQFMSNAVESQYVAIPDVQVASSDLDKTFGNSSGHTSINMVAKTGETFVIFTSKYASFIGQKVPSGSGTVKGVTMKYGTTMQICLTSLTDVAGLTGERFGNQQGEAKVVSIKEIRDLYTGADTKISENVAVEGTVISDYRRDTDGGLNNYTSAKTIVVSDGQYGLMLYCSGDNKTFARGDKVKVTLYNQTLSVYQNGPLQVNGLPLDNIEKTGSETPSPREITVDQLLTGNYESTYVAVKDVQVKSEFLGKKFSSSTENTSIAVEGKDGGEFDIFTSRYAVFRDETVPSGSGTLKGIAGKYGTRFQLTVSARSDYAGLTGDRFGSGTQIALPFAETSVWGGAGSFDLAVTATVGWTASSSIDGFTVTPASGDGSATVQVSYTRNPSASASRTAVITFTGTDGSVAKLTVTQQPYEEVTPSQVQPWLELPATPTTDGKAFFSHDMTYNGETVRNYSFWYDLQNRVSLWVSYPLYKGMTSGVQRTDKWEYDPLLPRSYQGTAYNGYGVSGYDRGHQLPSADRLCNTAANESTFYFTNLTPQNHDLNTYVWEKTEAHIRGLVSTNDTLYVVTGCVLQTAADPEIKYIKDNEGKNVAVPKAYFKVVLKYKPGEGNNGYSAIGFWFENRSYGDVNLSRSYARSVDDIEKLTGFDFFCNLDDNIEAAIEASYTASLWGL
ncbi:MAG: DNA/RNA non-specific endonuclease [Bacteroidales bacterium]|nr:DNA/RNA non-specific endonuclease [Bacteroidales bacterium]